MSISVTRPSENTASVEATATVMSSSTSAPSQTAFQLTDVQTRESARVDGADGYMDDGGLEDESKVFSIAATHTTGSDRKASPPQPAWISPLDIATMILEEDRILGEIRRDSGCQLRKHEQIPTARDLVQQLDFAYRLSASPAPATRFQPKCFSFHPLPNESYRYIRNRRILRDPIPRLEPELGSCPDIFEYKTSGCTKEWAHYNQDLQEDVLDELVVRTDPSRIGILTSATQQTKLRRLIGFDNFTGPDDCQIFSRPVNTGGLDIRGSRR